MVVAGQLQVEVEVHLDSERDLVPRWSTKVVAPPPQFARVRTARALSSAEVDDVL